MPSKQLDFQGRIKKAAIAMEATKNKLDQMGIDYAITGYEGLKQTELFKKYIQTNKDSTSERIRYFPDLCISLDNGSTLWEIKYSSGIEKKAYEIYLELSDIGFDVKIIFYRNTLLKLCDAGKLQFQYIKNPYINPKCPDIPIPVIDNKWICARKSGRYFEYKQYTSSSGVDFAYIDFQNTIFYSIDEWIRERIFLK